MGETGIETPMGVMEEHPQPGRDRDPRHVIAVADPPPHEMGRHLPGVSQEGKAEGSDLLLQIELQQVAHRRKGHDPHQEAGIQYMAGQPRLRLIVHLLFDGLEEERRIVRFTGPNPEQEK